MAQPSIQGSIHRSTALLTNYTFLFKTNSNGQC